MTTANGYPIVRMPRRSDQGIWLGYGWWNLGSVFIGVLILVLATIRASIPGFAFSAPLWVPFVVIGLWPSRALETPLRVVLWVALQSRAAVGATRTRYRPERSMVNGTVNLPGRLANVQTFETEGTAVIYNPLAKTISITAQLQVEGFMMLGGAERSDRVAGWGRVLSSFTQRDGVERVTLQERTGATSIEPNRIAYSEALARNNSDGSSRAEQVYAGALEHAANVAVGHRNYLTITLSAVKLQARIRELGGGRQGMEAIARMEVANVTAMLRIANIEVRRWLNVRQWAALVRTAFDPDYLSVVESRQGDEEGVSLAAIGPMALDEPPRETGLVRTDSGWHTTAWIHEWPRSDVSAGFVEPIIYARHPTTHQAIGHIFTIVLTPVPVQEAVKEIQKEKNSWDGNQRTKAKHGRHRTAADDDDYLVLQQREESLLRGDGMFKFGAYITVSATSKSDLNEAWAGMRNALAMSGMEPQVLHCQQAEALLVNAVPIGQGMS